MNWSEAIKAMAEGKKVRAANWLEGAYISATGQDDIGTGENYNLVLNATWELYDEESPHEEKIADILADPVNEIIMDIFADALREIMALSIFESTK